MYRSARLSGVVGAEHLRHRGLGGSTSYIAGSKTRLGKAGTRYTPPLFGAIVPVSYVVVLVMLPTTIAELIS